MRGGVYDVVFGHDEVIVKSLNIGNKV